MNGKNCYERWIAKSKLWSNWIRPTQFVAIKSTNYLSYAYDMALPKIQYLQALCLDTAIFVDTPSDSSIVESITLSILGWCPIPLFNGVDGQKNTKALVDNSQIQNSLLWASRHLQQISIPPNAPPAFLLDSNRNHRHKSTSCIFDNSWDLYGQDIPSYEYFEQQGISKIILRADSLSPDLKKIFCDFYKKGMTFYKCDKYDTKHKKLKLK